MLVAISIAAATITSGICNGPIDDIFTGLRDTSHCVGNKGCVINGIIGGDPFTDHDRDGGVFILTILLLITLVVREIFSWLWRLLWKQ